jgi:PAS domain S-box-containing protein
MPDSQSPVVVHGTEILATDQRHEYRQKLARIALDEMYQFVAVLDAQGTLLEVNRAALEGGGLTLANVEGKPFWQCFWWGVSAEIQETLRTAITRCANGEFIRYDVEVYGRAGGKETIIIDFSMIPVKDRDGRVVFIVPEGRDITEKKAREREIAQKNLELQGLLQRIRELDEIKTQFFANVSHELRTPLALILGPAQRLVDDRGAITLDERRESAHVIARNARMLLKHVNDLLDLSKLEAGKLKIELQDADVSALVRLVASHFAVLAADRHITYTIDASEPCVGAVDPDKLQRVIMNVLANAFKFVPDGGRVRCSVTKGTTAFVVAIDDSGPGVKPEMRQAIFERFRQAEGGATRTRGGTGLGLAIAKEFVEMHKGTITVLDSDFGGARFEISVPVLRLDDRDSPPAVDERSVDRSTLDGLLEELQPSLPASKAAPARPRHADGKVLVVEDNTDMNRFVVQCLSTHYEVASAFDGREGLEQALRFQPDLIVSDIMMPNMSGDEMIAELRKLPELKDTPILLLSAKADDDLKVKLLDNGAQDFIVKPFAEKDLLVRVRNLIQAEQSRAQVDGLRQAAESANRAKDEFLAMLGHELRNPLSPIVTALQLMKLQGPEESERARAVIERQVTHLTRLVDDLLDVSRIARGKVELKADLVEVSEIVAKAIEMASPLLEQRNHTLAVQVPRRGLLVDADITRLSQVLSNLLTNAAKYTPSGGHITIRGEAVGDEVVVHVRDTGIGITPDVLPHIFDLFVQERQAIDRAQGGLGIGLTIVRNLVERHGGTVQVASDGPGRGSEFTIRLPRATWADQSESIPRGLELDRQAAPKAGAPRVLIVDDNEDGAEMLSIILSQKGYDTRVAHDAPRALEIAAQFKPVTAFIDIGLPVMDGYELAERLRAMPALEGIRLIALTGYGQESDRRRGREAGFDEHLVKPVDINAVEAAAAQRR